MYGPNYREAFVKATTKQVEEEYVLDLPFRIYGQQIIYNGRNLYDRVPQKRCEVMAHVVFKTEDYEQVIKYDGFLGDSSTPEGRKRVLKSEDYRNIWGKTKEETYTRTVINDGKDKDKLSIASIFLRSRQEDRIVRDKITIVR